jgi:hypothetical protein
VEPAVVDDLFDVPALVEGAALAESFCLAIRSKRGPASSVPKTIRRRESASPWVNPHQPRLVQATDSDFFAGSPQVKVLPVPEVETGQLPLGEQFSHAARRVDRT